MRTDGATRPPVTAPHKTLDNRFVRWRKAGVFKRMFQALASESTANGTLKIDATHLKAHRTAASRVTHIHQERIAAKH